MHMTTTRKTYGKYILLGAVSIVVFVVLAQGAQMHKEILESLVLRTGYAGIITYIGLLVLAVVAAPISTGFLLPIAANSWGPLLAAVFSLCGWTLGAAVAFWLSRRYGLRFVGHLGAVQRLREVEAALPRRHAFLMVLLLRAAFPVEVFSYAIGVFSTMRFVPYFVATVIGIMPFTFLLSYASVASIPFQIFSGIASAASFVAGTIYVVHQTTLRVRAHEQNDDTLPS